VADIEQTFGILFSAEDLASPAVERAQAATADAANGIETTLTSFAGAAEALTDSIGSSVADAGDHITELHDTLLKVEPFDGLRASVSSTFDDLEGAINGAVASFAPVKDSIVLFGDQLHIAVMDFTDNVVDSVPETLKTFVSNVGTSFDSVTDRVTGKAQELFDGISGFAQSTARTVDNSLQTIGVIYDQSIKSGAQLITNLRSQYEVVDQVALGFEAMYEHAGEAKTAIVGMGKSGVKGIRSLLVGINKGIDGIRTMGVGLDTMGRKMEDSGSLGGRMGGSLMKGLGGSIGGGGLMAAVMGPIGPVLKLLTPLLDIIQGALAPAMETFKGLVENAFAPLSMTLETIIQSLAPVITKLMTPISALLEQIAIFAGDALQKMLGGVTGLVGPLAQVFNQLSPVAELLVNSLGEVAKAILPVLMKLFTTLAPIIMKVVKILVESMAGRMGAFAKLIEEVGPILVEALGEVLVAILPLIEVALKLIDTIGIQVLLPILTKFLIFVARGLKVIAAVLTPVIEVLSAGITFITDSLNDFFDNFDDYMSQLYDLFIQPFVDGFNMIVDTIKWWYGMVIGIMTKAWDFVIGGFEMIGAFIWNYWTVFLPGVWNTFYGWVTGAFGKLVEFFLGIGTSIWNALGLDTAVEGAKGAMQTILKALQVPIEYMKGIINEYVIGTVNSVLQWEPPIIGGNLASLLFGDKSYSIPALADGGFAASGSTVAEIGEAGTEVVTPVDRASIERFVEPIMPEVSVPGLEELIDQGRQIVTLLSGTLSVNNVGGNRPAINDPERQMADNGMGELGKGVGIFGLV